MTDEDNVIDVEAEEIPDDPSRDKALERWRPAQYSEEWWQWVSLEIQANRCQAHSSRTGLRCRRPSIAGARVCRAHGGAAKHVKQAARARLDNAADLMVKRLVQIARFAESEATALKAVDSVLDRSLGRATQTVELGASEPKPYEEVFEGIAGGTRAESRQARGVGESGECDPPASLFEEARDTSGYEFVDDDGGWAEHSGDWAPAPVADGPPPPRQPDPRRFDRQQHHVTGDAAIAAANAANRETGALAAIESPHRRYRRP